MKSVSRTTKCPKCGIETSHLHGTYQRKVQDLPILGKNVCLIITAHEYICDHDACNVSTFAETFDDFLNFYSRMTVRCADFICTLGLETSCEGCARICKAMNIHISGDSVIRLLIKHFQNQATDYTGTIVGVDDFALKKQHSYGTIFDTKKVTNMIGMFLDCSNLEGLDISKLDETQIYRGFQYECFLDLDKYNKKEQLLKKLEQNIKNKLEIIRNKQLRKRGRIIIYEKND